MASQRTDTFVVGPIIDDTMPFLMARRSHNFPAYNRRFLSFLSTYNDTPTLRGGLLSDTIFAELSSHVGNFVYLTCHKEEESRISDGVIYHYFSFKAFLNRSLTNFIGWLNMSSGYLSFSSDRSTIELYSTEPATYPGLPLLVCTNYKLQYPADQYDYPVDHYVCWEVYDNDGTLENTPPSVPIFDLMDDLLDTDLSDRYSDYTDDEDSLEGDIPTTNWCSDVNTTYDTDEFFFLPITWYNQRSCTESVLSNSEIGYNSFLPPSTYMMQCFTNNFDVYNYSTICNKARESIGYTTRDACLLYSSLGRFFYGPNLSSTDSCGSVVSSYPTVATRDDNSTARSIMSASSTVGTCSEGLCVPNDDQLTCALTDIDVPDDDDIPDDIIEDPIGEQVDTDPYWWRTRAGIIGIITLSIIILVVILVITIILTQFVFTKKTVSIRQPNV